MAYNPATDFLGLWRSNGGASVSKMEMPGLDYVISALARAGIINVSVSATPPVANQSTTAWLQAAVPSYSAEGSFKLWDPIASAYAAATPALFLAFLDASAGQNGVSWWTSTGGPPLNTVGNNGDFAIRLDAPNGIYGPKAAGAWPVNPIPGTADVLTSASLDNTFGTAEGDIIFRGPSVWQALAIGGNNTLLSSNGAVPGWETLSALIDAVFGSARGDVLYRGAAGWAALPPGTANQVLSTGGAGADPSWSPRTAEFPSGTSIVFHQTAAPTGWTKQVALNDVGLRVVSGSIGNTAGTAFSTVFAQTAVGATTLSTAQMPVHGHGVNDVLSIAVVGSGSGIQGSAGILANAAGPSATFTIASAGSGGSHTHSVALNLAYTDVIIAVKD